MDFGKNSLSGEYPVMNSNGNSPSVLLTPGRTRNIAQDMEALRLSRQDNPYIQKVMASRDSLMDGHSTECESEDIILMSQEFGNVTMDTLDSGPISLQEVHEHMIRSPPPSTFCDSQMFRASSAFDFSNGGPFSMYSQSNDGDQKASYYDRNTPEVMYRLNDTVNIKQRAARARSCGRVETYTDILNSGEPSSKPARKPNSERFSLLSVGSRRPIAKFGNRDESLLLVPNEN